MHVSRAHLSLLAIFDAVYSHGGVTRASEVLHLSQPAVSHALGRLREWTNDPLFVRSGRKLAPTPLARRLIVPIRDALQTIEAAVAEIQAFDPQSARMTFTVGIGSLMEDTFFLPLAELVQKEAPLIRISSVRLDRRSLEADLAAGELNAAIDVFVSLPETIRKMHISSVQYVVVARKGHPGIKGAVDIDTYLSLKHVLVSSRHSGQGLEDIALAREGLTRDVAVRCQQFSTAMRLVGGSNLVLTTPETGARRANVLFDHQIISPPFNIAAADTYVFWHTNCDADPANRWLRQMIIRASQTPALGVS
jgi:DNA-binding transcriptional LysR family regulator